MRARCIRERISARALTIMAVIGILFSASSPVLAGKPVKVTLDGASSSSNTPLALETESYQFRNLSGDNSCLGEDDHLVWKAIGDLQPGESFTFTPQYPACINHPAAISVQLSWQGSKLELSSTVPYRDYTSDDLSQTGKAVLAPVVGNTAQLCMFPYYQEENIYYSITVTNVGDSVAQDIVVDGRSENDWAKYYYSRCLNADADGDGWNDSLEHTMASLVRYIGYIDGQFQMNSLWGPNYLKAQADTIAADDEIDSYPADVNDDGRVDSLDIETIRRFLGQGDGIPLEQISPNPGDLAYFYNAVKQWRRYDLDGDGMVAQSDIDIVSTLDGYPVPMAEDIVAPTARVLSPANDSTVAKGSYQQIKGHVWDNVAIAKVEYLVDGQVECSATKPAPVWGTTSPYYSCWWNVPKRQGQHVIEIQVYDAAGNVSTSDPILVSAQ